MTDASHIDPKYREKEAPRYWQMLPDADKAKHRKRLNDIKQKYIKDYEKFLKVRCEPSVMQCHIINTILPCIEPAWPVTNIRKQNLMPFLRSSLASSLPFLNF
jgi:predicted glycoside hydrolase/deacetylase ChbG (UPF0249 family)